jgi:hypothetical protein
MKMNQGCPNMKPTAAAFHFELIARRNNERKNIFLVEELKNYLRYHQNCPYRCFKQSKR